jgi:uncharacterized lipoprotein YbaY
MIKWFLRRQVTAFERTWNYDAAYLHQLLDADPRALIAFSTVQAISRYRKDVPPAGYCAAALVAVMAEDCGPCTQLVVDMAERNGVAPSAIRAIVARDHEAMPREAALAARFAEASLRHAPEADDLREEVIRRWGQRGLIALAFAIVTARIYPTLKYALGHGHACTRITIGDVTRPVRHRMDEVKASWLAGV